MGGVRLNPDPTISRILRKINNDKSSQIEYGARKKQPSVLVLFDYTEWSGFGWQFFRSLADYLLGRKLGFLCLPNELSVVLYLERKVIDGRIAISKQRSAVYHNPRASYPLAENVFRSMHQYLLYLNEVEPLQTTINDDWFLL